MNKYILLIIFTVMLTACSEEGQQRSPDYLYVFQQYQKTDMYDKCNDFSQKVMRHSSDLNESITPYTVRKDMDIINSSYLNGEYKAELKCVVIATYSANAFTQWQEEFEINLGEIRFNY